MKNKAKVVASLDDDNFKDAVEDLGRMEAERSEVRQHTFSKLIINLSYNESASPTKCHE